MRIITAPRWREHALNRSIELFSNISALSKRKTLGIHRDNITQAKLSYDKNFTALCKSDMISEQVNNPEVLGLHYVSVETVERWYITAEGTTDGYRQSYTFRIWTRRVLEYGKQQWLNQLWATLETLEMPKFSVGQWNISWNKYWEACVRFYEAKNCYRSKLRDS